MEVSKVIAILPQVNLVPLAKPLLRKRRFALATPALCAYGTRIAINLLDLEAIAVPKQQRSITSSMLELFYRADRLSVLKSDFADPLKYVAGGFVGLFLAIVGINFILKSCDRSTSTSVVTNPSSSSPCEKIDDRLKAAKVSYDVVNNLFYGTSRSTKKKIELRRPDRSTIIN
jgi:hypothetical protein